MYLDVTVVSAGHVAERERRKQQTYPVWAQRRRTTPSDFSPVAFEHVGAIGEASRAVVQRLATRSAQALGTNSQQKTRRWLELLGASLQVENAIILATG